jgi:hypothetical protein
MILPAGITYGKEITISLTHLSLLFDVPSLTAVQTDLFG